MSLGTSSRRAVPSTACDRFASASRSVVYLAGPPPPRRLRLLRMAALAATASLAAHLAVAPSVLGCGGTPPPPMCGRTTTLTKTPPLVIPVAPAGGVFLFPVTVGVGTTGPCPAPLTTTVALTVTCLPPPGAAGMAVIPTPAPGIWPGAVAVAIPPGPPRVCTVSGTATTTWADGTTTVGMGDTVFCIVEPSPSNPGVPRLNLERLTPATQLAHPGDQRNHLYRLTNNDPVASVTVVLSADSEQVSRFPGGSPLPLGSPNGSYAISDPGQGDNFPLAFIDDLPPGGCVPLPPDPTVPVVPTISRVVTLPPGQSSVVGIAHRSWPMCGCGSACESRVMVEGLFSDGTPALACAGAGLSVDCNTPPDFDCPDGGAAGPVLPAGQALTTGIAMPTHTIAANIAMQTIMVGSQVLNVSTSAAQMDPFRSRITAAGVSPGGPPAATAGQLLNAVAQIDIVPAGGDSTWSLQSLDLHLAAPGFNDNYFLLNARSKVQAGGIPPALNSLFDVFQIVSLDGISNGLHRKGRILPGSIVLQPVSPTSYSMGFTGVFDPVPGLSPSIQTVNLRMVAQALATGVPVAQDACATSNHGCLEIGGPGCDDPACCALVCALDPFCCEVQWDGLCVNQAAQDCAAPVGCLAPGACPGLGGGCCTANGTPGCENLPCCETICVVDPFCCDVAWDGICANQAVVQCAVCATVQCPPVINQELMIIVQGTLFHGAECETISGWMVVDRDPTRACDPAFGNVQVSNLDCLPNGVVAGWIVPVKVVLWILKNADDAEACINVFDVSCGLHQATFEMGEPNTPDFGFGTATLELLDPGTALATFNIHTHDPAVLNYTGVWDSLELVEPSVPGGAVGAGSTRFQTLDGDIDMPFKVSYSFLGNPSAPFPEPVVMSQDVDFDCLTGDFVSTVCHVVPTPDTCPTDLNGDGQTGGADLGILLGSWGQPGASDFNGDGITDGADLGSLLGAWGQCAVGVTFNFQYDATFKSIDITLLGGAVGRKYTGNGVASGKVEFTEAVPDLTANRNGADSGSVHIKCTGAGGGKVVITYKQGGEVVGTVTICFTCAGDPPAPTETPCP